MLEWDGKDEDGNPLPAGNNVKASGLLDGENTEFQVSSYAERRTVCFLQVGDGNVPLIWLVSSAYDLLEVLVVGKA